MRLFFTALLFAALGPGQTSPRPVTDFPIALPGGQSVSPTQHAGKVVIVEILLTTCPHCQNSARLLSKLKNEYGPKGLVVLGGAVNENADIAGFVKMTGANFPVGMARRDKVYGFLQQSLMQPNLMMPILVIVDRTGQIRGQFQGNDPFFKAEEANLRAMLHKLVAEGRATKRKAS